MFGFVALSLFCRFEPCCLVPRFFEFGASGAFLVRLALDAGADGVELLGRRRPLARAGATSWPMAPRSLDAGVRATPPPTVNRGTSSSLIDQKPPFPVVSSFEARATWKKQGCCVRLCLIEFFHHFVLLLPRKYPKFSWK